MKKVLLLLIEGFEFYEASVFIDVIGWNMMEGDQNTRLYTCGLSKEVNSAFGQKAVTDYLLSDIVIAEYAALAVPGGFGEYRFYEQAYDDAVTKLILAFHQEDKWIASVCAGAFPVAQSGILSGRSGTTYNLEPGMQDQLHQMGVQIRQEPIVTDSKIITSWNPSTAVEVAFQLLGHLTSPENAATVKALMGFTA
ncbi:DJ-1/PfpI family protein [Mucilaginibacter celer]|uniref:DJ-1/PfpI family protein n=1 Tax=Mucilaginibacter celer TaxID=2305508 RepID=A0A494VHU4_9SPHI|nr:DJ-1/PfpI family protein [Mucilaginibacter celer]AYL94346.1 DJ-1/PfpI family protein [Mucilaginibacter celer]